VTVADVQLWGIGGAFWGFVVGVGLQFLLSRRAVVQESTKGAKVIIAK
jgi:predicted benzoate:H+ symporter BenE